MTGLHTGTVQVQTLGLLGAPRDGTLVWDAVEQATLWAPDGQLTVCGLMIGPPASEPNLAQAGAGLYRVEVRARHRRPDDVETTEDEPAEQYQLLAWPVTDDMGHVTIRVDDLPDADWDPQPARAAQFAMLGVLTGRCADPFDPNGPPRPVITPDVDEQLPRARVMRSVLVRVPPDEALTATRTALGRADADVHVMPVGLLQVTLTVRPSVASAGTRLALTWTWAWSGGEPPAPDDDGHAWAAELANAFSRTRPSYRSNATASSKRATSSGVEVGSGAC